MEEAVLLLVLLQDLVKEGMVDLVVDLVEEDQEVLHLVQEELVIHPQHLLLKEIMVVMVEDLLQIVGEQVEVEQLLQEQMHHLLQVEMVLVE